MGSKIPLDTIPPFLLLSYDLKGLIHHYSFIQRGYNMSGEFGKWLTIALVAVVVVYVVFHVAAVKKVVVGA